MKPFFFSRFIAPLFLSKGRRISRRPKSRASRYESLEARHMLAPVAANDSYSMNGNTTLSVNAASGLQANDTPDMGLQMTSSVVANPSHGSVTVNADGSFNYTPTTGYFGSADSFTYHDTDFAGTSNTATVTIAIYGPNNPIAVNDSYSVLHDRANSISAASGVLANDTDPNHLSLTASVVANPGHGTLTLNSNGSFTYTPTASFIGADSYRR